MGKAITMGLALSTWLLGVLLSCPHFVFYTTYVMHFKDGEDRVICYAQWPDGNTNESLYEYL